MRPDSSLRPRTLPGHVSRLPLGIALAALCLVAAGPHAAEPAKKAATTTAGHPAPAEFFRTTNLHQVKLSFTADQWKAMEPKGGDNGPFGGRGFGPGMFLAPAVLGQADGDKDGSVSATEFNALGERWFAEWDKDKKGKLNADAIRAGLNTSLAGGPPGGPGGGPGRPGGMMLQGAQGKRNGLSSAAGIEFNYVHANSSISGVELKDIAVRYKGNGTYMQSRGSAKRSLKLKLNEYQKGQKLGEISTLNLHNCVTDASWMNEVLSYRLYRDAGVPAPRTAYARVTVDVPGIHNNTYLGVYSIVENMDNTFANERFGTRKGAILKPVTPQPFTDLGDDWAKYDQTYDPKTDLTAAQKQRIIAFCKLVSNAPDAEFAAKLPEYLDIDNFARYMAVTTYLSTLDSILGIGQNYYVYLDPKTSKFKFLPWDLDHSFGQFPMVGSQEEREQLSIDQPWQGEIRFLQRVFSVDAFKKAYRERFTEFSQTLFKPERFGPQVDEIAAALRDAVREESAEKFERFSKVAAGEPVAPAMFGGPPPGGNNRGPGQGQEPPRFPGFGSPVKPIKGFVVARSKSVSEQLAGTSKGEIIVGRFGPGGGGPRGGGPGGGRPGGGRDFGPGMFLGGGFYNAMDADKDGFVSRTEYLACFSKWFTSWDTAKTGKLSEENLREGMNRDLAPGGPGGPGGPMVRPLGDGPGGPPPNRN